MVRKREVTKEDRLDSKELILQKEKDPKKVERVPLNECSAQRWFSMEWTQVCKQSKCSLF